MTVNPTLADLRRRLARLRRQRARLRNRLEKEHRELEELRAFSLRVFPDVELPESVIKVIAAVRQENLTYLTHDQLASLASCVLEAEAARRPGLIIEAGTALGGSAITMAAAKSPARPMRVYDVFGMIPAPADAADADVQERYAKIVAGQSRGPGGAEYYGYRGDLLGEVTAAFERHHLSIGENLVDLVKGMFQDTLQIEEPVALAHVDCDWYESTLTCLTRITPHLGVGGRIIVDDYFTWSGCRTAVDEFTARHPELIVEKRAKVHLVRRA